MSLPSYLSVKTARAADPNLTLFPVGFVDLSGNGAGPYLPAHLAVDLAGVPQVPALDASVQAVGKAVGQLLTSTLAVAGAVITTPASSNGLDYSANQPGLPPVGNPTFGTTGVYANFALLKTVPADPNRVMIEVINNDNGLVVVVRDDATASVGQQPVNATVFSLAPASAKGQSGGSWRSSTFKGRLQIYAANPTAQIAVPRD